MTVYIHDFINWDEYPTEGKTTYQDSTVHDFDFQKDGVEYFVKAYINIEYDRYFYPGDWDSSTTDDFDVRKLEVEVLKAYKYNKGDEIELKEREIRKIKNYIIEKIGII